MEDNKKKGKSVATYANNFKTKLEKYDKIVEMSSRYGESENTTFKRDRKSNIVKGMSKWKKLARKNGIKISGIGM